MTTETQDIPATFSAVEVNLASTLPGYEPRPPQQRMASAIEVALAKGRSIYAEAGCGTGKSLGGLIPVILHAVHSEQRVIVTTATKALMEQYATKDVPFLQEHSGIPFTWALVKGRSNYACWAKLSSDEMELDPTATAVKAELKGDEDHSGDREHFEVPIDDQTWRKMSSGSAECPGKSQCPFGEICLAEKAKRKGLESDVVITNHAMLMTDLVLQDKTRGENTAGIQMLGDRGAVLLDEAHELPEYAAGALGNEFTPRGVSILFREAMTFAGAHGVALDERVDACAMTMEALNEKMLPLVGNALTYTWFDENVTLFLAVSDLLNKLKLDLSGLNIQHDVDRQQIKLKQLLTRIANLLSVMEEMLLAKDHERVRWVDGYKVKDQPQWRIKISPVDVAPFLKKLLWDKTLCVLMSATLSTGKKFNGEKDFSYIQRTLGLEDADIVDVGTPFDYSAQGMMFVPAPEIPNPKDYARWSVYTAMATLNLIDSSKGGALLLYTSRKAMEAAHEQLAERLEDRGLTVLMQGDGRTNKELARIFKEDEHSVLFALKSFFVGVDVPGNACRLVVIDKLPFPVHTDPVYAARALLEKRAGRNAFSSLSVPMMTLALEQAVGRLIRTKDDTGIVAILDSRLTSEPYGHRIVAGLPDFPVTTDLEQIKGFYQGERYTVR